MKLKWFNHLQTYHLVTLFIATALSFSCFFIFKHRGSHGLQSVATIYESALLVEELSRDNIISDIEGMVQSDRSRIAIKKLEDLYMRSNDLHKIHQTDEFASFKNSYDKTHDLLNSLIKYPEVSKITSVLHEKMIAFEDWVSRNRWPTLTRISRRVNSTLSSRSSRGTSFYQKGKLVSLIKNTKEEVERMETVTKRSTLSSEDKRNIMSQIERFSKELELLDGFVQNLNSSDQLFDQFRSSFSSWLSSVNPKVALSRLELEKSDRTWQKAFLAIGTLFLGFFFLGILFSFRSKKRLKSQMEKEILDTIQNGLFPHRSEIPDSFSSNFVHQFSKQREFFHKRVVFGTVFQEAVPFSCFLLDSNLNLVWGNDLFYKHWAISKEEATSVISWDYLQQATNLGEDDPVMLALKQGIAGIYQVQMKIDDSEEGRPFEMYVSPVEYSEQKRIMIFLYPLSSLQDTIQDQIKSMIGPMRRTFEALTTEHFEEHRGILRKDFEVAGIGEIFHRVENYHELVKKQRDSLLEEMQSLENQLHDQMKIVQDSQKVIDQNPEIFQELKDDFIHSKETILKSAQGRSELESLFAKALDLLQKISDEEKEVVNQAFKASDLMKENLKAFSSLGKMRDSFKSLSEQMKSAKLSISQSLKQLISIEKREGQRQDASLSEVHSGIKELEGFMSNLEKLIRSFDVGLSKVEMMLSDCSLPNTKELHQSIERTGQNVDDILVSFNKESEKLALCDEDLVMGIKGLYSNIQKLKEGHESLEVLMHKDQVEHLDFEEGQLLS